MNDNTLSQMERIVDNIDQVARIRERIAILAILNEELNHVDSQLELDLIERIKGQINHRQENGLR